MATGDIVSVVIGADGWWADIAIAGLSTGGTYAFGLDSLNKPTAPKIVFTVVSLGFDDTGVATTVTRTVYGTKQVRQPYPNPTLNQESTGGGNVTVRVALSDYIYAKDKTGAGNSGTAVIVSILSGFYTQASTPNNAAAGLTVTNNSTVAYPKVVGNWAWPHDKITGSSFPLRAVAFHSSARSGRPVRCVKFTATDTHANTVTVIVTAPTVDTTVGDAVPVVEYVATMSATSLIALDAVTCNFIAYPWIGDANSLLDTSAGTAAPTPLYGPVIAFNDKSSTYGKSFASVDPVSGNDGTGAVVNTGLPTQPYLTISAAFDALRAYNNTNYARNNCGGSIMYLRSGNHAWMGGTPTVGTTPETWFIITRYPGHAGVNITTQSGAKGAGLFLKLVDIDGFSAQAASGGTIDGGFESNAEVWTDRIGSINCPTVNRPMVYQGKVWHLTRSRIDGLADGIRSFSSGAAVDPAVVRGNTIVDVADSSATLAHTLIGNLKTGSGTGHTISDLVNVGTPNQIIAYNKMCWPTTEGRAGVSLLNGTATQTHGVAIVQNVFEQLASSGSIQPLVKLAADTSTGTPVDNILIWHNVLVGDKVNHAYNEVDSAHSPGGLAYRRLWSVKNNICDDLNIKSDTFAGGGQVADATKVGNWGYLFGCGSSGNLDIEATGIGAPGTLLLEFPGINTDAPALDPVSPPTSATRLPDYPNFGDRTSFDGTTTGVGSGDYRVAGDSPAQGLPVDWLLPFDIAGRPRTAFEPAGAYSRSFRVFIPQLPPSHQQRRLRMNNPGI